MNSPRTPQLSKQDSEEFTKTVSYFQSDHKTTLTAKQFILQYRKNSFSSTMNEKSSGVARCALFLAEKSQAMYDMKGNKILGIGLSLNQILKSCPNIDQFISILKDFIKKVRLNDRQVQSTLHSTISSLTFSITFYNKFQKVLKQLNFNDKVSQSYGYSKTFFSFVWLLFIDSKQQLYKDEQDIVKTTCLLATCFYSMIRYCLDYIKPMFLSDITEKMSVKSNGIENKQLITRIISRITQRIFSLFSIQDYQTYKISVSDFDDYFQTLLQTNILKNSPDRIDFFCPELMNINYKRLDALYQKRLNGSELDERIFLKDRVSTLTPAKITPFQVPGVTIKSLKAVRNNKNQNTNPNVSTRTFFSHRTLEYQSQHLIEPKTIPNQNLPSQPRQVKFPKNVIFSPSIAKHSLICATPVTLGMEMYNYIIEKPKLVRESPIRFKGNREKILKMIQQFKPLRVEKNDSMKDQKTKEMRINIVLSLHSLALQHYLIQHPQQQDIHQLSRCLLALSLQTVSFVCSIPNTNFKQIYEIVNVSDLMTLYRTNEFYYRYDKGMPNQLKMHFLEIETQLITSYLWKEQSSIQSLSALLQSPSPTILLKRLLQQLSHQLSLLSTPLQLPSPLLQSTFTLLKSLLLFQTPLLYQHHLHQLIICSLYAASKTHRVELKFNDIKMKYQELNQWNKKEHSEIMCNVYVDVDEEEKGDIIRFYNGVFIGVAKMYVKDIATQ